MIGRSPMHKLEVAIIGCGYVANGHLEAWRKVPQAHVVAVSDLNEVLARNTAHTWKVPYYYKSLTEVMANTSVDLVDVCTPPQAHATLAIQAMEAGKNVLIEKPMAMTVKEAQEIVNCQRDNHVKAGVIHNWLFEQPVLAATSLVERGLVGEVLSVVVEALNRNEDSMAANRDHWSHRLPGGRFSEMLAHPIYLIRHFLRGEVNVLDVQVSKLGNYPWVKSDELSATFNVGEKLGRSYVSLNSSRDAIYVNLYGKEGIIKLDIINSTVTVLPRVGNSRFAKGFDSLRQAFQILKWTTQSAGKVALRRWSSGHDTCMKLFVESLANDSKPPVSVEDGLAVTKTLEETCKRIDEEEKKV